jgi:hypothetical protein
MRDSEFVLACPGSGEGFVKGQRLGLFLGHFEYFYIISGNQRY